MFETLPLEVKERIEREGSLPKLVSAFLSLAQDLIESGEADQILDLHNSQSNQDLNNLVVSEPVFQTDTGKR